MLVWDISFVDYGARWATIVGAQRRDSHDDSAHVISMRPSSFPLLATPFRILQPCTRAPAVVIATRYASSSTRARNLVNRHWELVRKHVHPAMRHVVDHEATKDRIADAGLRAATDMLPTAAGTRPTGIYVRGVKIPERPKPPESDGEHLLPYLQSHTS